MSVLAPKIDKRTSEEILEEIKALVPFYTPEWNVNEDKGVGIGFLTIFVNSLKAVIDRLNSIPDKNFIAFLNMLGAKLLPAQSSKAPVTFFLSEGITENVLIPRMTKVSAGDVVFETEKSIMAAHGKLQGIYSVVPRNDEIFEAPLELIKGSPTTFELFTGKNLQKHILYLGHTELFNITKPAQITLTGFLKLPNSTTWEYYGEGANKKVDWHSLTLPTKETTEKALKIEAHALYKDATNNIILQKAHGEIKEYEINGIKSRWIRCTTKNIAETKDITVDTIQAGAGCIIQTVAVDGAVLSIPIPPDMAFYNDVPLDIAHPIYPFGLIPRLYDTFYIAGQKAFSEKGETITLHITITMDEGGDPTPNPLLSWEYWDGNGWSAFTGISENFTGTGTINLAINNFPELKPTKVNGQENLWIRVRLIGGHYGQESIIVYAGTTSPSYTAVTTPTSYTTVKAGKITPPQITKLTIDYTVSPMTLQPLHHCLIYNNLEFEDVTKESKSKDNKSFNPFKALEDKHQTMYLGFDKKIEEGPISIYVSLEEQFYNPDNIPDIAWKYYAGDGKWLRLEILDGTMNLTKAGIVEFIAPSNLAKCKKFNNDLYWICVVDVEDKFKPSTKCLPPKIKGNASVIGWTKVLGESPEYLSESLNLLRNLPQTSLGFRLPINISQSVTKGLPTECLPPKIKGIYPNTTWAIQQETIKDELLGSSDGNSNQGFVFSKTPVVSEEVWVNEIALSEEERRAIIEKSPAAVKEIKNADGNTTEFWVKWQPMDDLLETKAKDRVYQSDRAFGKIGFGDGTHGTIPPIGRDNIKADYTTGGGKKGNVDADKITELKASIPFVDKVSNPDNAAGGSEIEILEMALERMPQSIKNRGQAVTLEDFEWIARESARDIVRVKCIPNFNNKRKPQPGWVTVIIVPESKEIKPIPSLQLKDKVKDYIKGRCSNIISEHIYVDGPVYVDVMIETTIYVKCIDSAPSVKNEGYTQIKAFLHPLTGGYEGRGWEFGRMPFLSDFFPILEVIEGVDYVESLSMKVKSDGKEETITEDRPTEIKLPLYTLIFSGEHKITVKWRSR
ncbi:MAG: putative baseplate assembly protein [bacterium]